MGKFCLNMLEMALRLANHDRSYEGVALKFFEHFASIAAAMGELWDEPDGFFYDRLRMPDGSSLPLRARSMVGLLPLFAAVQLDPRCGNGCRSSASGPIGFSSTSAAGRLLRLLREGRPAGVIALVDESRLRRVLARMLDEAEFLSPYGLRSLSRYHRDHPLVVALAAAKRGSTTSRPSRRADSSAATRTGAGRSGSR